MSDETIVSAVRAFKGTPYRLQLSHEIVLRPDDFLGDLGPPLSRDEQRRGGGPRCLCLLNQLGQGVPFYELRDRDAERARAAAAEREATLARTAR